EFGLDPDDHGLITWSRPTTRKTRIMAGTQQVCRLDLEELGVIEQQQCPDLYAAALAGVENADAVIFSDYDKGVVSPGLIADVVQAARSRGAFVAVDPQVGHFEQCRGVDVHTPNHHEAGRFLGRRLESDAAVEAAGFELI